MTKIEVSSIEMVLFDYGNVIARVDHRRFFFNLLGHHETGRYLERIYQGNGISILFESGKIGPETFKARVEKILGKSFPEDFFFQAFCDIFEPIEQTKILIRGLKGKFRLGLLSNTNITHFEKIIQPDWVFEFFDQITVSFTVGAMKPDKLIFDDVLKKSGKSPKKILYLDDIPEYVESARKLGFNAIVFRDSPEIFSYLKNLLKAG